MSAASTEAGEGQCGMLGGAGRTGTCRPGEQGRMQGGGGSAWGPALSQLGGDSETRSMWGMRKSQRHLWEE